MLEGKKALVNSWYADKIHGLRTPKAKGNDFGCCEHIESIYILQINHRLDCHIKLFMAKGQDTNILIVIDQ